MGGNGNSESNSFRFSRFISETACFSFTESPPTARFFGEWGGEPFSESDVAAVAAFLVAERSD